MIYSDNLFIPEVIHSPSEIGILEENTFNDMWLPLLNFCDWVSFSMDQKHTTYIFKLNTFYGTEAHLNRS